MARERSQATRLSRSVFSLEVKSTVETTRQHLESIPADANNFAQNRG